MLFFIIIIFNQLHLDLSCYVVVAKNNILKVPFFFFLASGVQRLLRNWKVAIKLIVWLINPQLEDLCSCKW